MKICIENSHNFPGNPGIKIFGENPVLTIYLPIKKKNGKF